MNTTMQTTHTGLPEDWFRRPAVARISAFLTGGSDHYTADRQQDLPMTQSSVRWTTANGFPPVSEGCQQITHARRGVKQ